MSEIDQPQPIGALRPPDVRGRQEAGEQRRRRRDERQRHRDYPTPGDRVSVAGLVASELTPRVEQAIEGLMQDNRSLQKDIDQLENYATWLEAECDRHSFLPMINRHAFLREAARGLRRAEQARTGAAMVLLAVPGYDRLLRIGGHAKADAYLTHVAELIVGCLQGNDVVGVLSDGIFGILLTVVDGPKVQERLAVIGRQLQAAPFYDDDGNEKPIEFELGWALCLDGQSLESLWAAAEDDWIVTRRSNVLLQRQQREPELDLPEPKRFDPFSGPNE